MRYSSIGIGIAFAAGIIAGGGVSHGGSVIHLYWAAVGIAVIAIVTRHWWRSAVILFLGVIAIFGAVRLYTYQIPISDLYGRIASLREVTGTVVSYPQIGRDYTTFTLAPDHIDGCIQVTWFHGNNIHAPIAYGDRVHLTGTARVPPQFPDFDYRAYLARRRIFATFAVDTDDCVDHLGTQGNALVRYGDQLRQTLLVRLDRFLPPTEAALAHGLLFGDRTAIPDTIATAFRHTGLMHLLAVSGLHLGIFLAGLWFGLRLLGLRPAITYPIVGLAVGIVLWVIGPRVSLVRAALLFAFLGLGSVLADLGLILRRWINPFQSLAAAGMVILAVQPTAIYDAGFQLSFGATAAILALYSPGFHVTQWVARITDPIPIIARPLRYTVLVLATSAAAQAGTAPVLAYHFGMIYPISLLGNLAAIPLATLALWIGLPALLLSTTLAIVPLGIALWFVLHALVGTVTWISRLPLAMVAVPAWTGVWIGGMVIYIALLAIYLRDRSSCTSYSTSITSDFTSW